MTSAFKAFRGYHGNEAATKKKILTDVFAKGDGVCSVLRMRADRCSLVPVGA